MVLVLVNQQGDKVDSDDIEHDNDDDDDAQRVNKWAHC